MNNTCTCVIAVNKFCNICGQFILAGQQTRPISLNLKEVYAKYFGREILQNVSWAPNIVCLVCYSNLMQWRQSGKRKLSIRSPMIWKPPNHELNDCYFCNVTNVRGANKFKKQNIEYPNVPSAIRPRTLEESSSQEHHNETTSLIAEGTAINSGE